MTNCSENFKRLKSEIADIFSKAEIKEEGLHSIDTFRWVKEIDADASECLQIAALAHDIDRGIGPRIRREVNETYDDYKRRHAKRSAQLIAELMSKFGYSEDPIEKTSFLVEKHEVGGDKETDILKDADSISFFSCNIEWYYKNKGVEETKREILYKYERATPKARQMIKSIKIRNKELQEMCKDVFNLKNNS